MKWEQKEKKRVESSEQKDNERKGWIGMRGR